MKEKDVENEMYEICSGIFYEGRLLEILKRTIILYDRYDDKTAREIAGLSKEEAEFYEQKIFDLQIDGFSFRDIYSLYEEVTTLIDIRICEG